MTIGSLTQMRFTSAREADVVANDATEASTGVDLAGVNASGNRNMLCVYNVGIGAGTVTIHVEQSSDNGSADAFADITDATTAALDESGVGYIAFHPTERYIRVVTVDAGGGGANYAAAEFVYLGRTNG